MPRRRNTAEARFGPNAPRSDPHAYRMTQDPPTAVPTHFQEPGTFAKIHINDLITAISCEGDGWLRTTFDNDAQVLYVFWKFNTGPYAGHYVCVRMGAGFFDLAVRLLYEKLADVRRGLLQPSKDRPYGG